MSSEEIKNQIILSEKNLDKIDCENLIKEIESMARRDEKALRSNLEQLLMHLLKWKYQSSKRTGSWERSIKEHRNRILEDLEESPSLKPYFEEVLDKCYQNDLVLSCYADCLALPTSGCNLY